MSQTSVPEQNDTSFSDISRITPNIYISDRRTSSMMPILDQHGIRAVLTLGVYPKTDEVLLRYAKKGITSMFVRIDDFPEENIRQHFESTAKFIQGFTGNGKNVLVHCQAGASQSPTIVAHFLMRQMYRAEGEAALVTPKEALEAVFDQIRAGRKIADPNEGFRHQLLQAAEEYYSQAWDRFLETLKEPATETPK